MNDLLTFAQAARLCPVEVAPHSVWRWARKGLTSRSGETMRLEHVRVGRRIFIPRDALGRFFEAVALSDTRQGSEARQSVPARETKRPPKQRKRAYENAMRELGVDE